MKNLWLSILLFGFTITLAAGPAPLFNSEEPVAIRLEAPIASLKKQRGDDPEWLDGMVTVENEDGTTVSLTIKIKARGNYRRKWSTCTFPPYWINFKKSEVPGTIFEGLDRVKVVAHCKETWGSYEPYLYREYLAYKTYNILTERSFRVRLARIHYFDTDRSQDLDTLAAFFIEPVENFENRHNALQVKDRFILPSLYNHRDLSRADMFQFFIGNTDFNYFLSEDECCHNGKAFSLEGDPGGLVPVPYDFDMSGIVKPPYAEPNPNFPILSVNDRLYRGIGVEREILEDTMNAFIRKKHAIYDLWENAAILDEKSRVRALKYIDQFYEILKNKSQIKRKIIRKLNHPRSMEKFVQESMDKENAN